MPRHRHAPQHGDNGSKLDARQRARDHRRDKRQRRRARRDPTDDDNPAVTTLHQRVSTVTFFATEPEMESGYVILDALPDMTEEWIDRRVYVRSPVTGLPDRLYLGIQQLDDTLAWIELSLLGPAPPPAVPTDPGAPMYVWTAHIGIGQYTAGTSHLVGIDCDASGNIWAADYTDKFAKKFSSAGTLLVTQSLAGLGGSSTSYPVGIDVDAAGAVRACIYTVHRIYKFPAGGGTATIQLMTSLLGPRGITLNGDETRTYITDLGTNQNVRVFNTSTGAFVQSFGDTELTTPEGVGLDAAGNVYVADYNRSAVFKYSPTPTFGLLATWGTPGVPGSGSADFRNPTGLHVDASDRIYVADRGNHRVKVYEADGTLLTTLGQAGSGPGDLSYPWDVATSGSNVYVSDAGNGRISQWTIT